jgi:hypothetical protein
MYIGFCYVVCNSHKVFLCIHATIKVSFLPPNSISVRSIIEKLCPRTYTLSPKNPHVQKCVHPFIWTFSICITKIFQWGDWVDSMEWMLFYSFETVYCKMYFTNWPLTIFFTDLSVVMVDFREHFLQTGWANKNEDSLWFKNTVCCKYWHN